MRLSSVAIFLLFVTGLATAPLESELREAALTPEMRRVSLGVGSDARDVIAFAGIFGSLGAFASDLFWLCTASAWENEDIHAVEVYIGLAIAADPGSEVYARDGARIIAYDIPGWRVREIAGEEGRRPVAAVMAEINREQAERALQILDRAAAINPDNARILVDAAMIHLNRLNDVAGAARIFRNAAEIDGAPHFTARIYGQLLRRMGRNEEAYRWYRAVYDSLPGEDVEARKPILSQRIRELETLLDVTPGEILPDSSDR
jgi:tetratricopeptide (TPR) repeat protein